MSADPMAALQLLPERRYVCLSEAEAAELGSGTLAEWREASRDGVHVSLTDYLDVLQDGARWRGLCTIVAGTLLVLGTIATSLGLIYLLGLGAAWVR